MALGNVEAVGLGEPGRRSKTYKCKRFSLRISSLNTAWGKTYLATETQEKALRSLFLCQLNVSLVRCIYKETYMLMKVKSIFLKDDKPGKDEKITFFKVCKQGCTNCDNKRSTGCCRK